MADAADSKSAARKGVRVRLPPPAPSPAATASAAVDRRFRARIEKLVYEGHGLARLEGRAMFVEGAAPGDLLDLRITRLCSRHGWAEIVAVVEPSKYRLVPDCPVAGRCGGCTWLHVAPAAQLRAKEGIVREALTPAGVEPERIRPIIGMETPRFFRNKMSLSFGRDGGRPVCGLHERHCPERVVSAAACLLQSPVSQEVVRRAETLIRRLSPCDWPVRLTIREGRATGERMIALRWGGRFRNPDLWRNALGELSTTFLVAAGDGPFLAMTGDGRLREKLGGFLFDLGPEDFFQTNTVQADRLLAWVHVRAEARRPRQVLELYAGTGAISPALAAGGARVVTWESNRRSVEAARRNVAANGLDGIDVRCGEAERADLEGVDLVLVDPPRAGLSPAMRRRLARCGAPAILYISCNPATLGRDARELASAGYRAVEIQPIDMFPHTHHIEVAVEFARG